MGGWSDDEAGRRVSGGGGSGGESKRSGGRTWEVWRLWRDMLMFQSESVDVV